MIEERPTGRPKGGGQGRERSQSRASSVDSRKNGLRHAFSRVSRPSSTDKCPRSRTQTGHREEEAPP
eukprot:573278-Pyramimonas_sp.AAC.1